MGGGASIDIKHAHSSFMHITDSHFQELLASKTAREKLFQDVAGYQVPGDNDEPQRVITLLKLTGYFTDNSDALYPGFTVNADTLKAAFKYTIHAFRQQQSARKGNPVLNTRSNELTKAMIHSFLPTLLLFMRVWDVLAAADKLVVEDRKVSKSEFLGIKEKLNNVHGVVILGETSNEDWEREFDVLDKAQDSVITFEETCRCALTYIKRPFDYSDAEDEKLLDEKDEDHEAQDVSAESLVKIIAAGVGRLAPEMPEVPRIESPAQDIVLPPASPRAPRSPRSANSLELPTGDIDAVAEEGEALASARILFV